MSDPANDPQIVFIDPGEEEKLLEGGGEDALPAGDQADLPSPVPPVSISFQSSGSDDPTTLTAVEGVIRRQSVRLDELKEQMRTINDQLRSILDNDEELTKVEEEVKAASARQKQRKTTLANNAESMQLKFKLKEIKENLKDIEESLSNHLLSLYQITGSKEFDTDDGGKREFDVRAKLRGKKRQE